MEILAFETRYEVQPGWKVQFSQLSLRSVMSTVDDARLRRLVATFQHRRKKSLFLESLGKSLAHYGRNGYGVITGSV